MNSAYSADKPETRVPRIRPWTKPTRWICTLQGGNDLLVNALTDAIGRENIRTKQEVTEIIFRQRIASLCIRNKTGP